MKIKEQGKDISSYRPFPQKPDDLNRGASLLTYNETENFSLKIQFISEKK